MNILHGRITRRDLLLQCAALGFLTAAPSLSLADAVASLTEPSPRRLRPTPLNEIGPFYKRSAPNQTVLRAAGDPGLPVNISGRILDVRGRRIAGASVEIWHADHCGRYDLEGYRFRTKLTAGREGEYGIESVMPGHYPDRVCQHVHYAVRAPGYKPLVTQLYFATDPVFEGDPNQNFTRDPLIQDRELVRPVRLAGDPKAIHAEVTFELVLEPL
jgi:catechol 1,2-dioxygenase